MSDSELPIDDEYLQREKWQLSPSGFYYSRIIEAPTPIELRLTPEDGGWSPSLSQRQSPDEPNSRDDFVLLNLIHFRPQLRRLTAALNPKGE